MSILEVQVNGGWVDLDAVLSSGIDPKTLTLRYKRGLTEQQYKQYGFSEVLMRGHWIDADEAYRAGKYWVIAPLRYKHYDTYKEEIMSEGTVELGTLVVYNGRDHDQWGTLAMVTTVNAWDDSEADYRLTFIGWDEAYDSVSCEVITDRTVPAARNEFTVVPLPALPEPPMADGFYVSKLNGAAYRRMDGVWLAFDTVQQYWDELEHWTDAQVRGKLLYLSTR